MEPREPRLIGYFMPTTKDVITIANSASFGHAAYTIEGGPAKPLLCVGISKEMCFVSVWDVPPMPNAALSKV